MKCWWVLLSGILASCCSIIKSGPFVVPISSDPAGATVFCNGAQVGTTPSSVSMRGGSSEFELVREGYYKQLGEAGHSGNVWVAGNILFGVTGIVGMLIDAVGNKTSIGNYDPIHIVLTPSSVPAPNACSRSKTKADDATESASSAPIRGSESIVKSR